jgi:hypothetical protein
VRGSSAIHRRICRGARPIKVRSISNSNHEVPRDDAEQRKGQQVEVLPVGHLLDKQAEQQRDDRQATANPRPPAHAAQRAHSL